MYYIYTSYMQYNIHNITQIYVMPYIYVYICIYKFTEVGLGWSNIYLCLRLGLKPHLGLGYG